MTVTAWRIVQARLAGDAFTGEGARLFGGRWNHKGTRMVYTAGSVSLAALELLVHLEAPQLLESFVQIPVEFNERICSILDPASLPADWTDSPAPASTKDLGTEWVGAHETAVLAVPSAIVPTESIFLLNPEHPDFEAMRIGRPGSLKIDARLLKSLR